MGEEGRNVVRNARREFKKLMQEDEMENQDPAKREEREKERKRRNLLVKNAQAFQAAWATLKHQLLEISPPKHQLLEISPPKHQLLEFSPPLPRASSTSTTPLEVAAFQEGGSSTTV